MSLILCNTNDTVNPTAFVRVRALTPAEAIAYRRSLTIGGNEGNFSPSRRMDFLLHANEQLEHKIITKSETLLRKASLRLAVVRLGSTTDNARWVKHISRWTQTRHLGVNVDI